MRKLYIITLQSFYSKKSHTQKSEKMIVHFQLRMSVAANRLSVDGKKARQDITISNV